MRGVYTNHKLRGLLPPDSRELLSQALSQKQAASFKHTAAEQPILVRQGLVIHRETRGMTIT